MKPTGKKKGGTVLYGVLTGTFAVLFAGACIGTNLAFASAQAVNIALQVSTYDTRDTMIRRCITKAIFPVWKNWKPMTRRSLNS